LRCTHLLYGCGPQSVADRGVLDAAYAQRIDTASGALRGTPDAVLHLHGSQTATATGVSTSYGNAVSAAGFVYEAINVRSDIWKLTPPAFPR